MINFHFRCSFTGLKSCILKEDHNITTFQLRLSIGKTLFILSNEIIPKVKDHHFQIPSAGIPRYSRLCVTLGPLFVVMPASYKRETHICRSVQVID
jgi:hypothetical protein